MLNQSAEYALKVVALIGSRPPDQPSRAAELAAELELPANYLSKILHQLAAAGILTSRRGRRGGFLLATEASRLTLSEVVAPFEDLAQYRACLIGNTTCSDRHACAAHHRWNPIARSVLAFLQETTVDSLSGGGGTSASRIAPRPAEPRPPRPAKRRSPRAPAE